MKKIRYYLSVIAVSLSVNHASATDVDFRTWGAIYVVGDLGSLNPDLKGYKYWLDGQGRFADNSTQLDQGIVRAALGYAINSKVTVWAGHAWSSRHRPGVPAVNEQRPWQQLTWTDSFFGVNTTYRLRLEQRLFDGSEDVAFRIRNLVRFMLPIPFTPPAFRLVLTNEVFIHPYDTDVVTGGLRGLENRSFAGIAYRYNRETQIHVGYQTQYIRRPGREDAMRHILGTFVYFNF